VRGYTRTVDLHRAFLRALGPLAQKASSLYTKPLELDLASPLPPRLRVYLYTLGNPPGGRGNRNEHKIVLRVHGQKERETGFFDCSDDRIVILAGYRPDLDIFAFWDASLYPKFQYARNLQVRGDTIYNAALSGLAEQKRNLRSGAVEIIIACRVDQVPTALQIRVNRSIDTLCQ
jgi:hypothetical protein